MQREDVEFRACGLCGRSSHHFFAALLCLRLQGTAQAHCWHQEPGEIWRTRLTRYPCPTLNSRLPQQASPPAERLKIAMPCHAIHSPLLQDVYAFALYVDQGAARSKLSGNFKGQAAAAVAQDQRLFDGKGGVHLYCIFCCLMSTSSLAVCQREPVVKECRT